MKNLKSKSYFTILLAILFSAFVLISCSTSTGGDDDDEDPIPAPAAVDDLEITEFTPTSVTLSWTAPVDDDEHGMVSGYDIRYTDYEPDENDWDNATQVTDEPTPVPGGYTQTHTVTGLNYGTTYYFALKCFNEEGTYSPISNMAEQELPVDYPVSFTDANLEAVIREIIAQPSGDIMYSSLLGITEIGANFENISDLTGLEYCDNLVFFHATDNSITDLSPLSNLENLWSLDVVMNDISDISPVASITSLGQLVIGQNDITDISSLSSLTNLTWLRVHYNNIVDISSLQYLTNLHWLDISGNQITDLNPLVNNAGLADGDSIYLNNNPLSTESINTYIPQLESRKYFSGVAFGFSINSVTREYFNR